MKIIDNAKKHGLPPCYALYDAPADSLYLYADFRGLMIGLRAAFRRGRTDSQIATFSLLGADWSAYPSTQERFHGVISTIIHAIVNYTTTEDTTTEDTTTEDTTTEDTTTEDTTTEDTTTEDTTTDIGNGGCSYRRKVSCAGNPATAVACVVFFSSGSSYVRAYQSRTRAYSGFHRYIFTGSSSAFLLYRTLSGWVMMNCVINRLDPVPYTETLALKDRAIRLACEHFGGV